MRGLICNKTIAMERAPLTYSKVITQLSKVVIPRAHYIAASLNNIGTW